MDQEKIQRHTFGVAASKGTRAEKPSTKMDSSVVRVKLLLVAFSMLENKVVTQKSFLDDDCAHIN